MIEIFWIQLFVQIYYFYRILLSQNVQKPLSRIPSLVNECPIVVFEVVDTLLIVLDQLCSLNLHDLINLQEELLRFLHGPKWLLLKGVTFYDFQETRYVLVIVFAVIETQVKEFLYVLELSLFFQEDLEDHLVLGQTYF